MSFQAAQAGSPHTIPEPLRLGGNLWRSSGPASAHSEQLSNTITNYIMFTLQTTLPAPLQHLLLVTGRDFGNTMGSIQTPPKKRGGRVLNSPLPLFFKGSGKIIKKQTKHHQTVKTLKFTFTKPFQKACVYIFSKLNLQPSPHDICHSYFCHKHSSS